jgi:hypothetical protein
MMNVATVNSFAWTENRIDAFEFNSNINFITATYFAAMNAELVYPAEENNEACVLPLEAFVRIEFRQDVDSTYKAENVKIWMKGKPRKGFKQEHCYMAGPLGYHLIEFKLPADEIASKEKFIDKKIADFIGNKEVFDSFYNKYVELHQAYLNDKAANYSELEDRSTERRD